MHLNNNVILISAKRAFSFVKRTFPYRLINGLFKISLVVFLLYILYRQTLAREDASTLWTAFLHEFNASNFWWLMAVIALMPVNWSLETWKWLRLVRTFTHLSFYQGIQAILCGVAISLFTPNRVGEYGGRILVVEARHNWQAVIATLVGSFAQLLVLFSTGLLGLILFAGSFLDWDTYLLKAGLLAGAALIIILTYCFFNIDLIVSAIRRIPYVRGFQLYLKPLDVLRCFNRGALRDVLFLALLRYSVYSLQYFMILRFFGVEAPLLLSFAGLATIFLIQTSIPLPPFAGLLARGEIALFVWTRFGAEEVNVLAATFGLFVINLGIPALLGAVFAVKINVLKSLGYEKYTD